MTSNATSSLPRRRFFSLDVTPALDKHGFIEPFQEAFRVDDLLRWQIVLVVAPPWTGKSFVAKQLEGHFRRSAETASADAPFGRFFHLTNLEYRTPEDALPYWWDDWRASDSRACWIVDAVDEDAKDHSRGAFRVLGLVEALSTKDRSRLRLLMFARENEVPQRVARRLSEMFGESGDGADSPFHQVRLAVLDFESARDFVGDEETFARVQALIKSNRLESIAGYPSVLDRLKRYGPEDSVTANEIWKDVVSDLTGHRWQDRSSGDRVEVVGQPRCLDKPLPATRERVLGRRGAYARDLPGRVEYPGPLERFDHCCPGRCDVSQGLVGLPFIPGKRGVSGLPWRRGDTHRRRPRLAAERKRLREQRERPAARLPAVRGIIGSLGESAICKPQRYCPVSQQRIAISVWSSEGGAFSVKTASSDWMAVRHSLAPDARQLTRSASSRSVPKSWRGVPAIGGAAASVMPSV
jgi:hypothetical protein